MKIQIKILENSGVEQIEYFDDLSTANDWLETIGMDVLNREESLHNVMQGESIKPEEIINI